MKKQQGFSILTLLIAAVAIFGILSAVVSMSRSGATVSSDSVRPISAAIVTQGNNLATAFTSAVSRGISDSSVTYGNSVATPGTNDLLNPSNTGFAMQTVPVQAFASGAAYPFWMYRGNMLSVSSVGTGTVAGSGGDYAFVVADLTQTVCQEINRSLTNSTTIPASGLANIAAVIGGGTPALATPYSTSTTGLISNSLGLQGCMSTTDNKYFYYVVVEAQ